MTYIVYAQLRPPGKHYQPSVHRCPNLREARASGHTIINHRGSTYEAVPMSEALVASTQFGPVSIRNHTADEHALISGVLGRLPDDHLDLFADQYNGIICVDWTGQNWRSDTEPGEHTILAGGANIRRTIDRNSVVESGMRIELTHSCMHELRPSPFQRRGIFTLWHELGHFAYNNGLTPRSVSRSDYGSSVHTGASEQPAYAYMWYYLDPSRLAARDRSAFDRLLGPTVSPSAR